MILAVNHATGTLPSRPEVLMTWVGLDWLITGFSSMFTQNPRPGGDDRHVREHGGGGNVDVTHPPPEGAGHFRGLGLERSGDHEGRRKGRSPPCGTPNDPHHVDPPSRLSGWSRANSVGFHPGRARTPVLKESCHFSLSSRLGSRPVPKAPHRAVDPGVVHVPMRHRAQPTDPEFQQQNSLYLQKTQ